MQTIEDIDMILTDRLVMRKFTLDDANDLFEYAGDKHDGFKYMAWEPHRNVDDSIDCIRKVYIPKNVLCITYSGKCIGALEIRKTDVERVFSFGYVLNRKFWGLGFMTEALKAVLDMLFTRMLAEEVWSTHAVGNKASGKVMEKNDMKVDMIYAQTATVRCGEVDVRRLYLTKEDYFANRNKNALK